MQGKTETFLAGIVMADVVIGSAFFLMVLAEILGRNLKIKRLKPSKES